MHYRRSDKLKFVDDKLKFVGHRSFDVSYQNILSIEDEPTIKRQPVIAHQPQQRHQAVGLLCGSETVNVLPPPGLLSRSMEPL